ncbi:MAG TPA: Maf family protein [Pyrinomonadaceae bacterium]|jgi:septum formation protein
MEKERERQASGAGQRLTGVTGEELLLASSSPRRAEILRAVGWPFEAFAVNIDESPQLSEGVVAYVERLAREKAEAAAVQYQQQQQRTSRLVLGADTIVFAEGSMLGKPRDAEDARRMLRLLSGRWHEVLTGVALLRTGEQRTRRATAHETTRVRFSPLSEEEIEWYVATGEPMDKAGAYAVQGRAALFIEAIDGDFWNVVGLPVRLVYKLVREMQIRANAE